MRFAVIPAFSLSFVMLAGCQAATDSAPVPSSRAAASSSQRLPSRPAPLVIPAGTVLPVKLETGLSSAGSRPGELVIGRLAEDVVIEGRRVLREGAELRGRVTAAVPSGRLPIALHRQTCTRRL